MKLAIGLFVITQFALAQGPSPALSCDRAPAARPNGQAAAGRGRATAPADPASPEDIADIAKLSALPAWHPGGQRWRLLHRAGVRAGAGTNQTCRHYRGQSHRVPHEFCREQVLSRR